MNLASFENFDFSKIFIFIIITNTLIFHKERGIKIPSSHTIISEMNFVAASAISYDRKKIGTQSAFSMGDTRRFSMYCNEVGSET